MPTIPVAAPPARHVPDDAQSVADSEMEPEPAPADAATAAVMGRLLGAGVGTSDMQDSSGLQALVMVQAQRIEQLEREMADLKSIVFRENSLA